MKESAQWSWLVNELISIHVALFINYNCTMVYHTYRCFRTYLP